VTEIIIHRVNTRKQLQALPVRYGAEIDIRSHGSRLVLNHEPYRDGESFEEWISDYRHGTLILNPKEEGLESDILEVVRSHRVKRFFFLDLTVPMMVKLGRAGIRDMAVRYSEYESLDTCLRFKDMAGWAWIDCFTSTPMTREAYALLKKHFKLCLVSPELEGHDPGAIKGYKRFLIEYPVDAVCTDHPETWEGVLAGEDMG
jgi:hypothetical protein